MAGKVCVITGAGSGLGRALAVELAGRGLVLALWDVSQAGMAGTLKEMGEAAGQARTYLVDVTDEARVAEAAAQVEAEQGPVEVLVNNAGTCHPPCLIKEGNMKVWRATLNVNAIGSLTVTQAIFPLMCSRKRGLVVFMSSITGTRGIQCHAVYGATKHFIEGLAKGLREEGLLDGVRVSVVRPSATLTNLSENHNKATNSAGESKEIHSKNMEEVMVRGLPWLMEAKQVAKQMACIIDLPDDMVVNEIHMSATGYPCI